MDLLTQLANYYASDKGTVAPPTGHHGPRLHFTPEYERHFKAIRNNPITLLEIGVGSGPSLQMWYKYFPNATIHAIDVHNQSVHNNDRVTTHVADQSKREDLKRVMDLVGPVDLIIDDGSHIIDHQQISLGFLYPYLKPGGQYWIEDLHTSDGSVWQGKDLYGYSTSFNEGESTVQVLEAYMETKVFNSPFLTQEENQYLTDHIGASEMIELPITMYGINKLALLAKKNK